eukprot:6202275-Pleurochrysis_carterae.AAC.1
MRKQEDTRFSIHACHLFAHTKHTVPHATACVTASCVREHSACNIAVHNSIASGAAATSLRSGANCEKGTCSAIARPYKRLPSKAPKPSSSMERSSLHSQGRHSTRQNEALFEQEIGSIVDGETYRPRNTERTGR